MTGEVNVITILMGGSLVAETIRVLVASSTETSYFSSVTFCKKGHFFFS